MLQLMMNANWTFDRCLRPTSAVNHPEDFMIPNAPSVPPRPGACPGAATASAAPNPERNVYFGETYVHTAWSLDAFVGFGVTLGGPDTFYKYATGETVQHLADFR